MTECSGCKIKSPSVGVGNYFCAVCGIFTRWREPESPKKEPEPDEYDRRWTTLHHHIVLVIDKDRSLSMDDNSDAEVLAKRLTDHLMDNNYRSGQ